jgi:hypothetical protein
MKGYGSKKGCFADDDDDDDEYQHWSGRKILRMYTYEKLLSCFEIGLAQYKTQFIIILKLHSTLILAVITLSLSNVPSNFDTGFLHVLSRR